MVLIIATTTLECIILADFVGTFPSLRRRDRSNVSTTSSSCLMIHADARGRAKSEPKIDSTSATTLKKKLLIPPSPPSLLDLPALAQHRPILSFMSDLYLCKDYLQALETQCLTRHYLSLYFLVTLHVINTYLVLFLGMGTWYRWSGTCLVSDVVTRFPSGSFCSVMGTKPWGVVRAPTAISLRPCCVCTEQPPSPFLCRDFRQHHRCHGTSCYLGWPN